MTTKQKVLGALAALSPAAVFAEGDAASAVSQLQTAATGVIDEVKPAGVAICVALFAIAGVIFAYRMIKARLGR